MTVDEEALGAVIARERARIDELAAAKAEAKAAAEAKAERDAALSAEHEALAAKVAPARLEPWRDRVVEAARALAREFTAARAADFEAAATIERMAEIERELGVPRGEGRTPGLRSVQTAGARRQAAHQVLTTAVEHGIDQRDAEQLFALLMD